MGFRIVATGRYITSTGPTEPVMTSGLPSPPEEANSVQLGPWPIDQPVFDGGYSTAYVAPFQYPSQPIPSSRIPIHQMIPTLGHMGEERYPLLNEKGPPQIVPSSFSPNGNEWMLRPASNIRWG
jgi:hypothetical protein